jgi:starch synthase (maltosyl-transferring)
MNPVEKYALKNCVDFPVPENINIENIQPQIEGGRWPIKREPGDLIVVTADLFRHSFEKFEAAVLYRKVGAKEWLRSPMEPVDNDSWTASFVVTELGLWEYTVEAWTNPPRDAFEPTRHCQILQVRVDAEYARNSAWYEIFPRSQGQAPGQYGTWDDCRGRLDDIQGMGFDTIYMVPIQPIGLTNRKGPNNALKAMPGDPGCPYAVGNTAHGTRGGGHFDLDPYLGSEESFDAFMAEARARGFQLALDIALNCSPDHPHVAEHPDWYYREADGTIKFAENPPKKYEDIYPYNYFNPEWKELWSSIRDMLVFWVSKGFTIFRIDNPHTKPFQFWEWVIADVKARHPEVVFLSEAFTRPKLMHRLAKIGFDQSYTYFTWRTEKWELEEYCKELTQSPANEYMRGIFFPTTPDIHPEHLKWAPREMFMIRLLLAATLSSTYGMLNGYELIENEPNPYKDELWNSEKYDFKTRDWNAEGNIKDFVRLVNQFRKSNCALSEYDNLRFHRADNDKIMVYSKRDQASGNTVLLVVNLDAYFEQATWVHLNMPELGLGWQERFRVRDLMDGATYEWGEHNFVALRPQDKVAHLFVVEKL